MSSLYHGDYRNSNLLLLISDKAIHLTTKTSQYILSWMSSTRIIKSSSKVNGPYRYQTLNPGVINTMFPTELMLDLCLILRKEATVISIICDRQRHLATKWTIFACKPPYFPIS